VTGPPALGANTSDAYADVERVFLPVGVAVFVLVAGTLLLLAWRGRRRTRPRSRASNPALEGAYVLCLAVIAGVLVAVTFGAEDRVGAAETGPRLQVRAVAAKWRWRFEYPAQRVVVQGTEDRVPALVVPAGEEVEFEGVSLDVVHAFWIPAMRFQRELFAERPTRFGLAFPEPGFIAGARCSFFCGLRHQDMRFAVDVRTPQGFRAWVRAKGGTP
jgi:cytochrome c oxidase subunit II